VSAFRTELGSLIQNLSISDNGTWESTETTWGQGFRAINQSIVNIIKTSESTIYVDEDFKYDGDLVSFSTWILDICH